jgi:ABC-2 type transport system permease protein
MALLDKVIVYEIKRAVARRKVISLVSITLVFEVGIYLLLEYAGTSRVASLLDPFHPYLWLVGILLPQSLLLHFIAISISSGSMSEEYEQGTVDFFMTKPITRMTFVTGKFIGGFILVLLIYLLMVALSIGFSYSFFGTQDYVNFIPLVVGSVILSAVTFYSVAFALGEMLRKSSLAFLISSSILIGSILVTTILIFVATILKDPTYYGYAQYLPSWGAEELPFFIAQHIPNVYLLLNFLSVFPIGQGTTAQAAVSIFGYSSIPAAIGYISFLRRDIPKKVT